MGCYLAGFAECQRSGKGHGNGVGRLGCARAAQRQSDAPAMMVLELLNLIADTFTTYFDVCSVGPNGDPRLVWLLGPKLRWLGTPQTLRTIQIHITTPLPRPPRPMHIH